MLERLSLPQTRLEREAYQIWTRVGTALEMRCILLGRREPQLVAGVSFVWCGYYSSSRTKTGLFSKNQLSGELKKFEWESQLFVAREWLGNSKTGKSLFELLSL